MNTSVAALASTCSEVDLASLTHAGVYVLLDGESVVYVGESENVLFRIGAHARRLIFTRALFVEEPDRNERLAIEGALCRRLNPAGPKRASQRYIERDAEILARFGLSVDESLSASFSHRTASCWSADTRMRTAATNVAWAALRRAKRENKTDREARRLAERAEREYINRKRQEKQGS